MNNTLDKPVTSSALTEAWNGIKNVKPGIRIREAAKELGVNEAVLLATRTGKDVTRLSGDWPALLKRFPELGRVMSLTRNDSCILEHKGPFQKVATLGEGARSMATVIGPIETRVFFSAWHVGFAVTDEKAGKELKSIQIFDRSGEAITKVYLQEQSDVQAYDRIVADFRSADQSTEQQVEAIEPVEYSREVDGSALLSDWSNLKDTHDFFSMLRKHNADRYHALEIAAGKFSYQVDTNTAPRQILEEASASKLPIMIFAGNRGNLQIHQGKVRTIRILDQGHTGSEQWVNVLDPDFNLHLRQNDVHSAWVVKKPTDDGIVTSIELFDRNKSMIAQFFGLRKPGIPEKEEWRVLVERLGTL